MHFNTYEEALEAVRQNGLNLRYVPEEMKTFKLCLAAVGECGLAIEFVP